MMPKKSGTKRRQPDKNLASTDVGSQSRSTPEKNNGVRKNYVLADPAYLETLGQTHSGWIFGAIAEIVDNSKDAKATKLEISIETHYSKIDGKRIPMLSLNDDGHGMSHDELVVMLSLGNKKFHNDDRERIGKYGVGFKTGAMKLGRNVIVLTQTSESRSVAFLSQTYNEGKDNLELPIISYRRIGSSMQLDTNVQTEITANYHLDLMKRFSPFDAFFIGEKFALFGANGQGTQVYIWNLEKSGSDFSLEWHKSSDNDTNGDDIIIRSRRTRQRFGQLGQQVPLDYSLRAYLEVIFLDPRMKISIQGSMVKSRLVAKSLDKAKIIDGSILGKPVQLILGHCQQEWERMNSGIFLYWHGRLIEAYKRVGGMVQNPEKSRGVIGVADVTDVMRVGDRDLVHNTKQAFQECPAYAALEEWLGAKLDNYCNAHSVRPHGTCSIPNVNMSPKQPAAKKTLRCPTKCSTSTVSVSLQRSENSERSEDDSDSNSERSEDDCYSNSERSEDVSDASSEKPHVVFNMPKVIMGPKSPVPKAIMGPKTPMPKVIMGPKSPAAKKSSNCAIMNSTASASNVVPKSPAAKKSSYWARRDSTASTSNVGSKLPAAKKSTRKGSQSCEAGLGFRKRFTRSSLCPPSPKE